MREQLGLHLQRLAAKTEKDGLSLEAGILYAVAGLILLNESAELLEHLAPLVTVKLASAKVELAAVRSPVGVRRVD